MNQHDEQHGGLQREESSPSGARSGGGTWIAEVPSETARRQDDETDRAAADPATQDAPVGVSEQAAVASAGDGAAGVTEPSAAPSTGDDRVDEALSRLAELDRLDVTEHAAIVEDVHRALQDTLAGEED